MAIKRKFLYSIILVVGSLLIFANPKIPKKSFDYANKLYSMEKPTDETDSIALKLYNEVITSKDATVDMKVESLINMANIYQSKTLYPLANNYYKQGIALNNGQPKSNKLLLYQSYLYYGSSLYTSNVIDTAQMFFEKAINLVEQNDKVDNFPEIERLYNSIGAIYFESANYTQAKNYFEKALQYLSTSVDEEESFVAINCNLSTCYLKMKDHAKALQILNNVKPIPSQQNLVQQLKAHVYYEMGKLDSALLFYEKIKIDKNFSGVIALIDVARINMEKTNWSKAEEKLNNAISFAQDLSNNNKNQEEAKAYYYRGVLAYKQGFVDEALRWNNYALQEAHLSFNTDSVFALPSNIDESVSPSVLYNIFINRADMLELKYIKTKNTKFLKTSVVAYKKAIALADYIKRNIDNDEAKQFLNDDNKKIFSKALDVAYNYHTNVKSIPEDIIFMMECYKGSILNQKIEDTKLKSTGKISDSLLTRERELKKYMAYFTAKLGKAESTADLTAVNQRLVNYRVELSRISKLIDDDKNLEPYRKKMFVPESIKTIQSKLNNDYALLNYFKNDTALFIVAISKGDFKFVKQEQISTLEKALTSYTDQLYNTKEGMRYSGHEAANALYNILIKPVSKVIASKKLVVLADDNLYGLPFEAIESDKTGKTFLLQTHQISYHYSIHLLLGELNNVNLTNARVISFAPFVSADSNINATKLPVLTFSAQEVDSIGHNIYKGAKAQKSSFNNLINFFDIAHLATHASVESNSGKSWIHFYPKDTVSNEHMLHLNEINNLQLTKTKLVVLSACQTGSGASHTGEGLMSLSRSFIYAGANGVVSTYWKTDDWVTNYVIQKLYNNIKQGLPPEKALHYAKLSLLKDDKVDVKYKMPSYWANFIYTGSITIVKTNSTSRLPLYLVLVGVLGIGAYFVFKKRGVKI